jgi:hypothetical protein
MSLMDVLPDTYQFTAQDIDRHWEFWRRDFWNEGPTLSEEEQEFFNVTDDVDRLSRLLKRLPTMGELRKWWAQEARDQERKAKR